MPFTTLATINTSIIFGLSLLVILAFGHVLQRFRLTQREENTVMVFFGVYVLFGIADRALASHLTRLAMSQEPLGIWSQIAIDVRLGFGVVIWAFLLYAFFGIWRRRL